MADPSTLQHQDPAAAVRAFVAGAYTSPPPALLNSIRGRTLSFLQLVRILGEYLTDEQDHIRARGLSLLSGVLQYLALPASPADAAGVPTQSTKVNVNVIGEKEKRELSDILNRQATRTLAAFFADKLDDAATLGAYPATATSEQGENASKDRATIGKEMTMEILRALNVLARLDTFGAEDARAVAQGLFSHVQMHVHAQATRFQVFSLLDALVARHRTSLRTLPDPDPEAPASFSPPGARFARGYVRMAEGEKDPRNLLLAFHIDRVLLVEWEMQEKLVEEFFDITFCYFPITFRPPPDDPYGITSDDLKVALRACLSATPAFAPHAMPLLLDKLAAAGGPAKRDTLETLSVCLPVYGKAATDAHAKQLWEGLKIEIFHATDDETDVLAQKALESMLRVLYADVDPPEGLAARIVADCLEQLEEPEKSLAKPATKALACLVRACSSTSYFALYAALDQLLRMFKDPAELSIRASILSHVALLFSALRQVYNASAGSASAVSPSAPNPAVASATSESLPTSSNTTASEAGPQRTYEKERPLDSFRDELLSALANGLRSTGYRASALEAFVNLCHIPGFLEMGEITFMAEAVNQLLIMPEADDVRSAALAGLASISRLSPRAIEETTLPLLFSVLPDRMPSPSDVSSSTHSAEHLRGRVRRSLSALAQLCAQSDLFDTLVVRLCTKLDLVCSRPYSEADHLAANVGYARGLLSTLRSLLEVKTKANHSDLGKHASSILPRLFKLSVVLGGRSGAGLEDWEDGAKWVAREESVLREAAAVVCLLTRRLSTEKQIELATNLYAAFENGTLDGLIRERAGAGALPTMGAGPKFGPFNSDAPTAQRDTVILFSSVYIALRKDVPQPRNGDVLGWLADMLSWTVSAQNALQTDAGLAILSAVANKHLPASLPDDAHKLLENFWRSEIEHAGNADNGGLSDGSGGEATAAVPAEGTVARRVRAVQAWFWIAKALIVRAAPEGEKMVDAAREKLFDDPVIGRHTARALTLVAKADDGILNKENGATLRLLHRQRFFSFILPRLIDGYRNSSSPSSRTTYLIALAVLLPNVPRSTTAERLDQLFPLLLQALDLPDPFARTASADTILYAIELGAKARKDSESDGAGAENGEKAAKSMPPAAPAGSTNAATSKAGISMSMMTPGEKGLALVEEHVHSLVDRLLVNVAPGEYSTVPVRVSSLRCLSSLGRSVPYPLLHPYQSRILRTLGTQNVGIDDPKRVVRIEAVDSREVWYMVGSGKVDAE